MSELPPIQDFDDPTYDPFAQNEAVYGDLEDVHSLVREVARRGPVQPGTIRELAGMSAMLTYESSISSFMALSPEAVREVLGNPDVYSSDAYRPGIVETFGNSITQMRPAEHGRYRRIFQKAFLPHMIARWGEAYIEPVLERLMGELKKQPTAELVEQFTRLFPFQVIFEQLALPKRDIAIFHKLSESLAHFIGEPEKCREASEKLGVYFSALIEERRRNPGEDIISTLIQVEVDGEHLPDDVVLGFCRQLMNAGGDTTYRSLGNMLVGLLRERPDQYAMLVSDRTLVPKAIDEAMRWESPINWLPRLTLTDAELFGVHIPAGSIVETIESEVGRDPSVHADPDKFDIERPNPARHFGFGYGPHICIGQHLARLEMNRALNALLDNFPKLRLDPDYPPPVIRGTSMRSPDALHVLLD